MTQQKNWIEPLARMGYASRGLVYIMVGLFAVLAALGMGETQDPHGAIVKMLRQPMGSIVVAVLIAGLVGYVIWRIIQSVFDTDNHGVDPKGLAVRGGLLTSAFTYSTLALFAFSLLRSASNSDGGGSGSVADWMVGLFGNAAFSLGLAVIFLGVSIAHIWKAIKQKYADHFMADEDEMKLIHPISMVGLISRGIVFAILSFLAFYQFTGSSGESEKPNVEDAFRFIQDLPAGHILLTLCGIGLIAFALYSLIEAKWRRINVEDA